jgi:hypothetical protein
MDEARTVLRRLRRLEALEREGAPARWLLAEVHALVEEAQAWVEKEGPGANLAEAALARCRDSLAGRVGDDRNLQGKEAAMR